MNLLFVPYAGGNQYSFIKLIKYFPRRFNSFVFELPGRGDRTDEPLLNNIDDIVNDLYRQIIPYTSEPYAFFGHSMGGLLVYLLSHKIISNELRPPVHLFVSGTTGPSHRDDKKISSLEKTAFISKMREYNGMPDEVLNNNEIMDYFEPILRHDFRATENYEYVRQPQLLVPISVLTGINDRTVEPDGVQSWLSESLGNVDFYTFPGDHFFIFDQAESIVKIVSDKLAGE